MPAYTIQNSAGANVATIGIATTTGNTFPIELVGQGISLYGPIIATTQYRLLENFTKDTPPVNPVRGMLWYAPTPSIMSFYDGAQFIPLSGPTTNSSALFDMLPTATDINLGVTGVTPIFTDPNNGGSYHATAMLLKVRGTPTAIGPALLNLQIVSAEDVLENVNVLLPSASQHAYFLIQGTTRVATGGATINLEVTSPASGGTLRADAYLFGFKT
jgi:hypothetical protein